jgi:hypothetical protein
LAIVEDERVFPILPLPLSAVHVRVGTSHGHSDQPVVRGLLLFEFKARNQGRSG